MSFKMPSISPCLAPLVLAVTFVLGSTHPPRRSWGHPAHSRFVFAEDNPIYEPSVTHHRRPSAGPRWGGNIEVNERGSLTQLRELARSLRTCGGTNDALLQLQFLKDRRITCNDGSPAGYYLRKSQGSKRWIIFLEGGWFCHSRESCEVRRARQPHLTGSTTWRWKRPGHGILSPRPEENPRWWNANTVIIPYCSSDVWSGNAVRHDKEPLSFLGARIVHEVIAELVQDGMSSARTVLLAGSSAGGTGVLLNLDRVAAQLQELRIPARVRGLADSGWFVRPGTHDAGKELQTALRLWNSTVPERCHLRLGLSQAWRCFYGYEMFPTLTTPVFVSQWLFDEAQLEADQVHLLGVASERERRLAYLRELGGELRASLQRLPFCSSLRRSHIDHQQHVG
uniref:palmitoleoyl-protein carboxylesterase NOTUM-like isoform X2 n=1 Tax=Myxine glutinosa TaxID=7769 RepID=UPI00358F184A